MFKIFNRQFFDAIIDNWRKDLRDNPVVFWIEMLGTISCMIASGTLAIMAPKPNLIEVYCFYLVGSTSLIISSYMRSNGFWVFLNMFFWCVDVIGLWNTLKG